MNQSAKINVKNRNVLAIFADLIYHNFSSPESDILRKIFKLETGDVKFPFTVSLDRDLARKVADELPNWSGWRSETGARARWMRERAPEIAMEIEDQLDSATMTEMPHIEADIDLNGKHMQVIDLRIERYPVPPEEKKRLMQAFSKKGVVGNFNGELLHFKPDYTVDVVDQDAARQLPMLPRGWEKHMQYVTEGNDGSIPKNDHLPDPKDGGKFVKTAPTYAIQIDEPFTVNTIEGEAEAKAGDFLAQGPNGDMWPVDQTIFKQSYKPIDSPKMEKVFKRK